MAQRITRIAGAGIAVLAGIATLVFSKPGQTFPTLAGYPDVWPWAIGIGVLIILATFALDAIIRWAFAQIRKTRLPDLITAAIGLIVGLSIAVLLTFPLSQVHFWDLNSWLPLLAAIIFGYAGVAITVLKREEIQRVFGMVFRARRRDTQEGDDLDAAEDSRPARRGRHKGAHEAEKVSEKVLLDTSAIIDGRIADISQTGFIMGTLVVPRFVLEELQHIADSADTLRRNRGRRGLDILNRLQKETNVPVEITDADFDNVPEVDAKLVKLAKALRAPIITNDFNLNKVAELQGIKVLNINELANAVKPALLPGEEMDVKIIQEGKEPGQGVGYLDDGTMIVVEGGKAFLSTEIEVTVTRVLQTVAGRMIFAQPKSAGAAIGLRRSS